MEREALGLKANTGGGKGGGYILKSCFGLGSEDVSISSHSSPDAQGSMETRGQEENTLWFVTCYFLHFLS